MSVGACVYCFDHLPTTCDPAHVTRMLSSNLHTHTYVHTQAYTNNAWANVSTQQSRWQFVVHNHSVNVVVLTSAAEMSRLLNTQKGGISAA